MSSGRLWIENTAGDDEMEGAADRGAGRGAEPPYTVEIADLQELLDLDEADLREVAERTLAEELVAAAEISVALVDNATIHALNRDHLQHDEATDVLSFLLDSRGGSPAVTGRRGAGKRLVGEVVISAEMARDRAPEFGWSPRDETVLYLVHGLLHLAGYDDLADEERRLMRRREREILALWDLAPHAADD